MVVSVGGGGGGGGVGCIIGGFGGGVGSIGGSFCVSGGGSGWKLTGLMPVKAIASLGVWEEASLSYGHNPKVQKQKTKPTGAIHGEGHPMGIVVTFSGMALPINP